MCRLEKFHLPLRPNLKDWNMMTLNKKWMRLMVLVGCAALTASCKQAPVAQMEAEYAVLKVSPSDKVLSTTYSATIRGRQDIDIYPQVSGFLTRLCVEEGQAVRKGQVLFIIDQVPYKAASYKLLSISDNFGKTLNTTYGIQKKICDNSKLIKPNSEKIIEKTIIKVTPVTISAFIIGTLFRRIIL